MMKELIDFLSKREPGKISGSIASLLAGCWYEFDGAGEENTAEDKLLGRMENVYWNPPILSFRIERHGKTVGGSTRADLHKWEINIETKKAECIKGSYRQLYPRQPNLDVQPMAEEIANLIVTQKEDDRLQWRKDGSVRVHIGKLLPNSGYKATLENRRKRFRSALDKKLAEAGWKRVRPNVYSPQKLFPL